MFDKLERFFFRPSVRLSQDSDTQGDLYKFVQEHFDSILSYCEENPAPSRLIKRDYAFVPDVLDLKKTMDELKSKLAKDPTTRGYVNVYLTSGRVLNWAIDNKKDRV